MLIASNQSKINKKQKQQKLYMHHPLISFIHSQWLCHFKYELKQGNCVISARATTETKKQRNKIL